MLNVRQLRAGYRAPVLHGLDFDLAPGEIVALLGRNGCGRSTLAKALMGLVAAIGQVRWQGQELLGRPPHEIARLGLGYVPEGRDVFPTLSVQQNLSLGLRRGASPQLLAQAYELFPALVPRAHAPAGVLSGGEQQMLSLARALMGQPRLLIVDEPTEGLAPQLVQVLGQALARLRAQGVGILLIEQKFSLARRLADRVLLMGRGSLVFSGTTAQLDSDAAMRQAWLEI